jgi:hypothetical protein
MGGGVRRALLIGVDDYLPVEGRRIPDLAGPTNDVPLMREVLAERGFDAAHLTTLLGAEATRDGILAAIDALIARAAPGDHLVVYYSGPGSQVAATADDEADGLYETIVPHDGADIVDKTLRQRWNRALDAVGEAGSLTVIQDNCHSGSGSRDPLAWTPRQADPAPSARLPEGDVGPPPNERGALLLAASQEREVAVERPIDGVVYGGFTASLARALRGTPPGASASVVFERTLAHVRALGLRQEGVIEGPAERPLFGEAPAPGGGLGVSVAGVDGGRVTLRGGLFMGLDVGAELVRFLSATADGAPRPDASVRLRVVGTEAAVRSVAEVTAGALDSVRVGDLFRITRPVPMRGEPLRLWLPPARGSEADVLAAAAAPCPGGPCSDVPIPAPGAVVVPTATGWRTLAGADAGVRPAYRPLPPMDSLRRPLAAALGGLDGVALTDDPAEAHYWLAGERADGAVRYRWVRRATATTGDTLQALPGDLSTVPGDARGAGTLAAAARQLATVQRWLTVPSPETASFPVEPLGLRRASDGVVLRPDASGVLTIPASTGPCSADPAGCYTLALGVTPAALDAYRAAPAWERWDRRYAYAFIIDPAGEACLYLPYARCQTVAAVADAVLDLADPARLSRAPTAAADSVVVFDVREASPRFAFQSGPFGRHTLVLVTTNEPLPQPGAAFNWPAIRVGTRGDVEEPGSWSVHRLTVDVLPDGSTSSPDD